MARAELSPPPPTARHGIGAAPTVLARWNHGAVITLLLVLAGAAAGVELRPPTLVITARPELEPVARSLRDLEPASFTSTLTLLGLADPGAPITVQVVGEEEVPARAVPAWVAGYAVPAESRVVLLAERSPRYPDNRLETVLRHEVAHVLIHRASGGQGLPRWLDEGLALAASRETELGDLSRVALGRLLRGERSFAALDAAFGGSDREVAEAYAEAREVVRFLLRELPGAAAHLLAARARGDSVDQAFRAATGSSLAAFEKRYHSSRSPAFEWLRLLSNPALIGLLLAGLAFAAFRARRRRDRLRQDLWEAEEELARSRYRAPREASTTRGGGARDDEEPRDETIH